MVPGKAFACILATAVLIAGSAQAAPILTLATTSSNSSYLANAYTSRYATRPIGLTLGKTSHSPDSPAVAPVPSALMASAKSSTASSPSIPSVVAGAFRSPPGQATADAFLNFGNSPYASENQVTAGNARPWFESPAVSRLFGGVPGVQQQADFRSQVIDRVARTFNLAGVPINLTVDPNAPASCSVSVVSGTYSPQSPGALGMTQVGGNGFSFIDQAARLAKNVDQLSWIVSHNVAHELMHAFGVLGGRDITGQSIDSPTASFGMMINPDATFSTSAARELRARDLNNRRLPLAHGAQFLEPSPVPEPTTIALWVVAASSAVLFRARKRREPASA